jgi:hypothetical protein
MACAADGREPQEVRIKIVEYPEPDRLVAVAVPVREDQRGVHELAHAEVHEAYGYEPRCVDVAACDARAAAALAEWEGDTTR